MIISYQNFFSGIMEVHIEGSATDQEAFIFWDELFRMADEKQARALLYNSSVEQVLNKEQSLRLVKLFENRENLEYLALVRNVLPNSDQVQAYTALGNLSRHINFHFEVFYSREEAMEWLKEQLA